MSAYEILTEVMNPNTPSGHANIPPVVVCRIVMELRRLLKIWRERFEEGNYNATSQPYTGMDALIGAFARLGGLACLIVSTWGVRNDMNMEDRETVFPLGPLISALITSLHDGSLLWPDFIKGVAALVADARDDDDDFAIAVRQVERDPSPLEFLLSQFETERPGGQLVQCRVADRQHMMALNMEKEGGDFVQDGASFHGIVNAVNVATSHEDIAHPYTELKENEKLTRESLGAVMTTLVSACEGNPHMVRILFYLPFFSFRSISLSLSLSLDLLLPACIL